MYSLVIDTTTKNQFLGIFKNGQIFVSNVETTNNSHMEIIFDNLQKLINKANLNFNNLNEIIVVNGPGSFTGVRIGIIVSKVIAKEFSLKLYTISTLKLLATSNLTKNQLVIFMSKLKIFVIKYDIINGKLENIQESSKFNEGEDLTELKVNYENIFKHRYLLDKTSHLDAEVNYIETPNYVKKLNK